MNIMGSTACSSKHTDVSWDHRFSNADFWTAEQKEQFGIRKTRQVRATPINAGEDTNTAPIEELQREVGEAVLKHDQNNQASIDAVTTAWDSLVGMGRNYSAAPRPATPDAEHPEVVFLSARDTLPLAEIAVNWRAVVPTETPTALGQGNSRESTSATPTLSTGELQLMPDQIRIVQHVTQSLEQTLVFVLAGGGNGKTVLINAMAAHFGKSQMNFSHMGVAAALLPDGETLASVFGTNLSAEKKNYILKFSRTCRHIVIDEISMCGMMMLLNVNSNLQAARRNTKPFGGIKVTLVGDMMQIRAVKANNIYDEHAQPDGFQQLLRLFTYYTDGDFSGNKRSDGCPLLADIVATMRTLPPFTPGEKHTASLGAGVKDWSEEERIAYAPMTERIAKLILTPLSPKEAQAGFAKAPCTIFNRTNRARAFFNINGMRVLGLDIGCPVFIFRRPLKPHSMAATCSPLLYSHHRFPELFSTFVKGAPAVLSANENVSCGVTNGTSCVMHSLHWLNAEQARAAITKAAAAGPGDLVEVDPPDIFFVELTPHKCQHFWKRRLARFPFERNMCPPCTVGPDKGKKNKIVLGVGKIAAGNEPNWAHAKFGKGTSLVFNFRMHSVMPAISMTAWKTQGQSFPRALMDICKSFNAQERWFTWELVYVMITRVSNHSNIRLMPATQAQLAVLLKEVMNMRPSFFATRFRCFAEIWAIARRAREALQVEMAAQSLVLPVNWTVAGNISSDGHTAEWTCNTKKTKTAALRAQALEYFQAAGVVHVVPASKNEMKIITVTLQPGMLCPPRPIELTEGGVDVSWAAVPTVCLMHAGAVCNIEGNCASAPLAWLSTIESELKADSTGPVKFSLQQSSKARGTKKREPQDSIGSARSTPIGTVATATPIHFASAICDLASQAGKRATTRPVHHLYITVPSGQWKDMPKVVKEAMPGPVGELMEDTAIVMVVVTRVELRTEVRNAACVDLSSLYKSNAKPVLVAAVAIGGTTSAYVALCKHSDRWWLKTDRAVYCEDATMIRRGGGGHEMRGGVDATLKRGLMFFYAIN